MTDAARAAGVHVENDDMPDMKGITRKYVKSITNNPKARFSDDVGKVAQLQGVLKAKADTSFAAVAALFGIPETDLNYEWQFLRRLPMDLSTSDSLTKLYTQLEKRALLPSFSMLARKIMLIGTAEVGRSFSTINRILRSECCRLLPEHVDILMKISIEGPGTPDVRDGTNCRGRT